ncbi:MAG: AAA family ATPase, partial [Desulfobulbaceae bacterium]|nr:AAA family ATPase [Desulfobulbaceae bacterium]
LRRYWEYEDAVAKFVIDRGQHPDADLAMDSLAEAMARLFPKQPVSCDWQRLAALAVVLRPFVVITGGPGTGKTTTVARIIALLIEQQCENMNSRIVLAAPTGKAVMRLQTVMEGIRKNLACSEQVRERIPTKATTLHRLLGSRKDSSFFKYDAKKQLPYDMVVVDEASMVDLPLMAKLMRALRPETKLVLLGDRNQLASVEPGAVLGDICSRDALPVFSRDFLIKASSVTCVNGLAVGGEGQADSLVELQVSHRFSVDSGIDLVGQAINRGDSGAALEIFQDDNYPDVVWRDIGSGEQLRRELACRYKDCPPGWFGIDEPSQALQRQGSCQVLCAVRQSAFGVKRVNGYIEEALVEKWGVVPGALGYPGRP